MSGENPSWLNKPPRDRHNLVFGTFITLGVASLLPFNVVLCQSYFYYVRSHTQPYVAPVADNFLAVLANSYTVANLVALAVLIPLGRRVPLHWQITGPIWVITALLMSQAGVACLVSLSGNMVMVTSVAAGAVLGCMASAVIAGAYGLAGKFPARYTQAVVVGQAASGLAISLLAMATAWIHPPDPSRLPEPKDLRGPAVVYFTGAAAVMVATLIAYLLLPSLEFVQHHLLSSDGQQQVHLQSIWEMEPQEQQQSLLPRSSPPVGTLQGPGERRSPGPAHLVRQSLRRPSASAVSMQSDAEDDPLPADAKAPGVMGLMQPGLLQMLRGYPVLVGLTFGVSFFIVPSFMIFIRSTQPPEGSRARLYGDLFVPGIFVIFNLGDCLGRLSAGLSRSPPASWLLSLYCLARVALIPAFLCCYLVTPHEWAMPLVFRADVYPVLFVFLLGLTNGHLGTMLLMHAPSLVPASLREQSGTLMAFSVTAGLAAGTAVALVTLPFLQHR